MIKKAYSKTIFLILLVAAFVTVGGGNLVISKPGFEVEEPAKPEVIQKSPTGKDTRSVLLDKGDGVYRFMSTSTDAAGNTSGTHIFEVELDTKAPEVPVVGEAYICGSAICADVKGEDGAYLVVNGQNKLLRVGTQFRRFILRSSFSSGTFYSFRIALEDRAKNKSSEVVRTVTTPVWAIGDGGVVGGESAGPNDLAGMLAYKPDAEITITHDGRVIIENLVLPAPIINYAQALSDKEVEVKGIAIPAGSNLTVNAKITKEYYSIGEAVQACGMKNYNDVTKYYCMSQKLGDIFPAYYIKVDTRCRVKYWPWEIDDIKRCIRDTRKKSESIEKTMPINLAHLEVVLMKNNQAIITEGDRRHWHSNPEGKWEMKFPTDLLKPGDTVRAKIRSYGGIEVEFDDKNYKGDFGSGLESGWSEGKIVAMYEALKFVSPIKYYCEGAYKTSGYGWRVIKGVRRFHDGVDIGNNGKGCVLNPIMNGKVKDLNNGYGETVVIKHPNKFKSIYGHNAEIYVEREEDVVQNTRMSFMGDTGEAYGIHLHLRLDYENAPLDPKGFRTVDPLKYFNL